MCNSSTDLLAHKGTCTVMGHVSFGRMVVLLHGANGRYLYSTKITFMDQT